MKSTFAVLACVLGSALAVPTPQEVNKLEHQDLIDQIFNTNKSQGPGNVGLPDTENAPDTSEGNTGLPDAELQALLANPRDITVEIFKDLSDVQQCEALNKLDNNTIKQKGFPITICPRFPGDKEPTKQSDRLRGPDSDPSWNQWAYEDHRARINGNDSDSSWNPWNYDDHKARIDGPKGRM